MVDALRHPWLVAAAKRVDAQERARAARRRRSSAGSSRRLSGDSYVAPGDKDADGSAPPSVCVSPRPGNAVPPAAAASPSRLHTPRRVPAPLSMAGGGGTDGGVALGATTPRRTPRKLFPKSPGAALRVAVAPTTPGRGVVPPKPPAPSTATAGVGRAPSAVPPRTPGRVKISGAASEAGRRTDTGEGGAAVPPSPRRFKLGGAARRTVTTKSPAAAARRDSGKEGGAPAGGGGAGGGKSSEAWRKYLL